MTNFFSCIATGQLRGYEEEPPMQLQRPFPKLNEKDIVLGQSLYECINGATITAVAACNHPDNLFHLHDIPNPAEIVKTDIKESFSIVLTTESRFINFFSFHYSSTIQNFALSSTTQLPSWYNPNITEVWTFNGSVPGPTIRAKVGDVLVIHLRNLLPFSTGFFIPGVFNAREPLEGGFIRPAQSRTFRIPLSMPGTFQYHSTVDAQRQIAMGLFGTLIVTDRSVQSLDDQVLVISDPLIDDRTWQIYPPLTSHAKRAEEQYNGRYGNVILINGESISSGLQLQLTSGVQHRLRLLNVCNSRMWKITIPSLKFRVQTQWSGPELFDEDSDTTLKSSLILPPGSTADMIIDIVDWMAGSIYEVVATEITPITERRRAKLKLTSQPTSLQPESPIVSETWTTIGPSTTNRAVELLLVPSIDGIVSLAGFTDSLNIPKIQISFKGTDIAAQIASCDFPWNCSQPAWGFKTAAFVPQDAEVVDASLLFEAICPSGRDIPSIFIRLFGIPSDELMSDALHVPQGTKIFNGTGVPIKMPLTHSTISCIDGRTEVPIDFRGSHFTEFIQRSLQGNGLEGRASLAWMRAEITYAGGGEIAIALRVGTELPPPTLRMVYKTSDQNAGHSDQIYSTRPQDIEARQRRLSRVFREMQNEQEDMRVQLQSLYNRVQQKQNRRRIALSLNETTDSNVVRLDNKRRLERHHIQLLEELQNHLYQQEEQKAVEKKLGHVQNSDLPEQFKNQLIKELRDRLQVHYLKQQMYQQQLKRRLNLINQSNIASSSSTGGAFLGVSTNNGVLSLTESRILKQEKFLYLKLYKQYNEIVSQMKHLKKKSNELIQKSRQENEISLNENHENLAHRFYEFVSLTSKDDPWHFTFPQRILNLKIVAGLSAVAPNSIVSNRHDFMGQRIHPVIHTENSNGTKQIVWADGGGPIPSVTLTLGQATEADSRGHVPMWIGARVTFPDECPTELEPGTLIVWEIINRTPLTHTLYFHRVLLEVFEREISGVGGTRTQRVHNREHDNNNGRFIGITIPAANLSDSSHSTVRAVSMVPRLTGVITSTNINRWDIRIQSTTLEYISNGMTTRLYFNVISTGEEKGVPSGIDFSAVDMNEDNDIQRSSSIRVIAAAGLGGAFIAAAIAMIRCYRNVGKSMLHTKKRGCHADDELLAECGFRESPSLETTPTTSLGPESSIIFNSSTDMHHDYRQHGHNCRFPSNLQASSEISPERVKESFLQSPDRIRQMKHRPGAAIVGSAISPLRSSVRSQNTPI